jgi:hypothetical protein
MFSLKLEKLKTKYKQHMPTDHAARNRNRKEPTEEEEERTCHSVPSRPFRYRPSQVQVQVRYLISSRHHQIPSVHSFSQYAYTPVQTEGRKQKKENPNQIPTQSTPTKIEKVIRTPRAYTIPNPSHTYFVIPVSSRPVPIPDRPRPEEK